MSEITYIIIFLVGLVFALISGFFLGKIILIYKKENLSKKFRREAAGIQDVEFDNSFIAEGFARKILNYLVKVSYSISHVNDQL